MLGKYWITYLMDSENKEVTNRIGINKIATKYYHELYKSDYPKNYNSAKEEINPNYEPEPEITIAEVQSVIKNLKNNRAKGCDNLTNKHSKEEEKN